MCRRTSPPPASEELPKPSPDPGLYGSYTHLSILAGIAHGLSCVAAFAIGTCWNTPPRTTEW